MVGKKPKEVKKEWKVRHKGETLVLGDTDVERLIGGMDTLVDSNKETKRSNYILAKTIKYALLAGFILGVAIIFNYYGIIKYFNNAQAMTRCLGLG